MGRSKSEGGGFLCFCRPKRPEDTGAVASPRDVFIGVAPFDGGAKPFGEAPPFDGGAPTTNRDAFAPGADPVMHDFFGNDTRPQMIQFEDNWFQKDEGEAGTPDITANTENSLSLFDEEEYTFSEEDPMEAAYRVWYNKGMLSFVPKSLQEERISGHIAEPVEKHSNGRNQRQGGNSWEPYQSEPRGQFERKGQISEAVQRKEAKQKQRDNSWAAFPPSPRDQPRKPRSPCRDQPATQKSKLKEAGNNLNQRKLVFEQQEKPLSERNFAHIPKVKDSLKFPPPPPPATTPPSRSGSGAGGIPNNISRCTACSKDASESSVRCEDCGDALYCSGYCRGSDRYPHSRECKRKSKSSVPNSTRRYPQKSPDKSQKVHSSNSVSNETRKPSLHEYWQQRDSQSSKSIA